MHASLHTGMLELQGQGFGTEKQIPSLEMAAAGIDTVVAITGCLKHENIPTGPSIKLPIPLNGPPNNIYPLLES